MITHVVCIEEFMVKKGELTLHKDTKQGSTSKKDKTKYVNKSHEFIHDGVIDNVMPKPAKVAFNLTNGLNAAKNTEKPPLDNKTSGKKPRNPWALGPK